MAIEPASRQIDGHKFVRQEPIHPYFADFVCRTRRLIIEIDGATHATPEEIASDARRTEILGRLGFRVIRFTNIDIYESLDWIIEKILETLSKEASHPPASLRSGPNPLPASRGEGK